MTQYDLNRISGQCSIAARHGGGDFSASGDYRFVAAAAAVNIVGEMFRGSQDFNDCMTANGAVADDRDPSTQMAQAPLTPPSAGPIPIASMGSGQAAPMLIPTTMAQAYYPGAAPALSPVAQRSMDSAAAWLRVQDTLGRMPGTTKQHDLLLVLCGAGDGSSCAMAAIMDRRASR